LLPVAALSYIGADEARLATTDKDFHKRIRNRQCRHVIIGDWLNPNAENYEVFHRFRSGEPFKYPVAVAFNADKTEGWTFEEFPGKFADYFKSVIDYDKRADQVILAGKGISSSITNVENDGVISKSGSDVYYNYLIYIASLTLDEYFICREINRAIAMNFPGKDVKLGFWIDIPAKM
jgi:arginyl-tRNA--protein-N-Asp/Glu arginylyltransferase